MIFGLNTHRAIEGLRPEGTFVVLSDLNLLLF